MGLKNITGLWKSDKGHLQAKVNQDVHIPAGTRLFVFKNKNRRSDRDPEYNLTMAVDDDGQPSQTSAHRGGGSAANEYDGF